MDPVLIKDQLYLLFPSFSHPLPFHRLYNWINPNSPVNIPALPSVLSLVIYCPLLEALAFSICVTSLYFILHLRPVELCQSTVEFNIQICGSPAVISNLVDMGWSLVIYYVFFKKLHRWLLYIVKVEDFLPWIHLNCWAQKETQDLRSNYRLLGSLEFRDLV